MPQDKCLQFYLAVSISAPAVIRVSTFSFTLLLQQLSKYTDPGHPDCFHIENALETMKQMINILNDSIQSSCRLASNSHMRRSYKRRYVGTERDERQQFLAMHGDEDNEDHLL